MHVCRFACRLRVRVRVRMRVRLRLRACVRACVLSAVPLQGMFVALVAVGSLAPRIFAALHPLVTAACKTCVPRWLATAPPRIGFDVLLHAIFGPKVSTFLSTFPLYEAVQAVPVPR